MLFSRPNFLPARSRSKADPKQLLSEGPLNRDSTMPGATRGCQVRIENVRPEGWLRQRVTLVRGEGELNST